MQLVLKAVAILLFFFSASSGVGLVALFYIALLWHETTKFSFEAILPLLALIATLIIPSWIGIHLWRISNRK